MLRYADMLSGGYQSAPPPFQIGAPRMPDMGPGMMQPGSGFGGMLQNPQPALSTPGGPKAPKGSASGWLDAIKASLGEMDPADQLYLGASAIGGIANWWERRQDRNEDKRRYEEQMEQQRRHRAAMGNSWNATYGG